jgi:hypothetical protein
MYTHKHRYVYEFLLSTHKSRRYESYTTKMTYTLCTDHDGPRSNANRRLLEQAIRCVYGYYPKGVKYVREKHD